MASPEVTGGAHVAPRVRDISAHALGWGSLAFYSFVTTTVVFRASGQAEYGVWATVLAFRSALLLLDGGLALGLTRDTALATSGDRGAVERLRSSVVIYVAAGATVGLAGMALSWLPAWILGLQGSNAAVAGSVTALVGVETALALAFAPAYGILRGLGRFELLARASVTQAVLGSGLLIVLALSFGLTGAAAALVAARMAGGAVALSALRSRTSIGPLWPASIGRAREVIKFAVPMWAVAVSSALGMAADIPIVGAFFGPLEAGAYGLGAVMPALVASLVFVLLDTAYPRLTTLARASSGHVVRILALSGALVAGIGFGALVSSSRDILVIWVGAAPDLALSVGAAYAAVWLVNVPTHVLVLAATARGVHGVIAPLVTVEAISNLALSIALAAAIGPVGPALATIALGSITSIVVFPVILGTRLGISAWRLLGPAATAGVAGVAIGVGLRVPILMLDDPLARVLLHAAGAAVAIALAGWTIIALRSSVQRWIGIIFDGGWRVLRAERQERRRVAAALLTVDRGAPRLIASPLVTVRIATYNRGALVAERAIASALNQTYRNIEVLVIGDDCDEATENAVRSLKDRRVRFQNLPRRGQYPDDPMFRWMVAGAAPMNRALELASGQWIAPLDDDDEFTPEHVEVLLDACRERQLDLTYGVADMEVSPDRWQPVGSWPPSPGGIVHSAVLYSMDLRSLTHSFESWRLNEPGDWNLWRRMLAAGAQIGFVDHLVVRHYLEFREVRAVATT